MATLAKFGVPLDGQRIGMLQPKLSHKFRVIFQGFGYEGSNSRDLTGNIVSCARPNIKFATVAMNSYNSIANVMGKKEAFGSIAVVLRDDITGQVTSLVGSQVQRQMNFFEQTSAVSGANYKFGMEIHTLDGTNNEEMESWVLEGCFLTEVKYTDGGYDKSEVQTIALTVMIDNATLIAGPNTNMGTIVGGDPYPNIPIVGGGTTPF